MTASDNGASSCAGRNVARRQHMMAGASDDDEWKPILGRRRYRCGDRGGDHLARPRRGRSGRQSSVSRPQLYTATILYCGGPVMVQAFHASIASHPAQIVQRLRTRFGDDVVPLADIRLGFHPSTPIAIALVPATVASVIRQMERNDRSTDLNTFVVDIEQRVEL